MPSAKTTAGGEKREDASRRYRVEVILWSIGTNLFIVSCIIIHAHPQPYSFDLATTQFVQGLLLPVWLHTLLVFPSLFNNPLPSIIAISLWFVWFLVMALIFHKPVREWRYRWFLLPLQIYAVFDILSIGYSRILQGEITGSRMSLVATLKVWCTCFSSSSYIAGLLITGPGVVPRRWVSLKPVN